MDFRNKNRVVIKIGTSTLTHPTGRLNLRRMEAIVKTLADLHNAGRNIILVSSGSIGLGAAKLGLGGRPKDTPGKQACAAVGQCELMYMYDQMFSKYSITVAQVLLTKYVLLEDRRLHVQNAMRRLLDHGALPIVNENDTVAIDELELEVGENDSLAAIVAEVTGAELLVMMTDIDGLYDRDPHLSKNAKLIPVVEHIDRSIWESAGGAGTALGTGGMKTKINAAEIATKAGVDTVIMNGRDPEKLYDLFANEPVGTVFLAERPNSK